MLTYDRLREFVTVIGTVGGTEIDAVVGQNKIMALCRFVEAEARKMALEEAAKAVEKRTEFHTPYSASWHAVAKCAAAIRALIDRL